MQISNLNGLLSASHSTIKNMKNIIQTAEQLLGRKLTANDGYTTDEIKQAENMLGLTMPEASQGIFIYLLEK